MGTRFPVVMVDDGELDDVRELLTSLRVEFAHLRGGAVPRQLEPPRDLFLTTARHAALVRSWPRNGEGDGRPLRIVFGTEDSPSARRSLRRLGYSYLVRRPVHPAALRLLLLRALYRGDERRAEPRVPVGIEVTLKAGLRRRDALLADLSSGGCRLVADRPLDPGTRLEVQLREPDGDGEPLPLSGRVLRCERDASSPAPYVLAVRFERLDDSVRTRLEALVARDPFGLADAATPPVPKEIGPRPEAAARPAPPPPARIARPAALGASLLEPARAAPAGGSEERPERLRIATPPSAARPAPRERRRHPRGLYQRKVLAAADDAMHRMLLGRDLSVGGMRIDAHPDLALGTAIRVALYDPFRETPLVVEAVVARDDGPDGLALRFEDVGPDVAARLESLVTALPPVEYLLDGEAGALGTVVSEILS